jgi:glycogen debranching enzyme
MSQLDVGYSPLSYHNGTVWPHDTSICIAGLVRAGFHAEAATLARQLFDAADRFEGRLPELFAGLDRTQTHDIPVSYPTTCSPQAWAAAAPILVVTELLGVTPGSAAAAPPAWLSGARIESRA